MPKYLAAPHRNLVVTTEPCLSDVTGELMRILKYVGAAVCILLIIGTLPSVTLIINGLVADRVDDAGYFVGKLTVYLLMIALLAVASWWLLRSARKRERK